MIIDVWDLEIDDVNRDKLHANGISLANAFEVVDGDPRVLPNHVKDGAPYTLVGPTSIGFVTLPIDETQIYGVLASSDGLSFETRRRRAV